MEFGLWEWATSFLNNATPEVVRDILSPNLAGVAVWGCELEDNEREVEYGRYTVSMVFFQGDHCSATIRLKDILVPLGPGWWCNADVTTNNE